MSIVLQVDRYHNITPNARVREIGIGLTTAPSTSSSRYAQRVPLVPEYCMMHEYKMEIAFSKP